MTPMHRSPNQKQAMSNGPLKGRGNLHNAENSFIGVTRKPEVDRPSLLSKGDYFAGFKARYKKTGKIPDIKTTTDLTALKGFKRFCQWIKFHKPPFPESETIVVPKGTLNGVNLYPPKKKKEIVL